MKRVCWRSRSRWNEILRIKSRWHWYLGWWIEWRNNICSRTSLLEGGIRRLALNHEE